MLYRGKKQVFINLFKYQDVFAWTNDDMQSYDTTIFHHTRLMKEEA